jgi:hypothetical protein
MTIPKDEIDRITVGRVEADGMRRAVRDAAVRIPFVTDFY